MKRRPSERGHTMVEVIVAGLVFTIGAVGLLPLYYRGTEGLTAAGKIAQATLLAERKLAELNELAWGHSSLAVATHDEGTKNVGPAGTPYAPDGSATGNFGATDGWFIRRWTVTDVDINTDTVGAEFKQITVTVSWYDTGAKRSRQVAVTGGKSR